jgi:hypothetical protein
MKHFLILYILLILGFPIMAQNKWDTPSKYEKRISLNGYDAWIAHKFYVDVYINTKSAKIVFAYQDSIRFSNLKTDERYSQLHLEQQKFDPNQLKPRWFIDSVAKVFEEHASYTKDSIFLDLENERGYGELLQRFCNASKEELAPKVENNSMDGYTLNISIMTQDKNWKLSTDCPKSNSHPLLFEMMSKTIYKNKYGDAVKKILSFYDW